MKKIAVMISPTHFVVIDGNFAKGITMKELKTTVCVNAHLYILYDPCNKEDIEKLSKNTTCYEVISHRV